jgi:hypothetical protein
VKDNDFEIGALGFLGLASLPLLLWFFSGLYARVARLRSHTAPALVLTGGTAFTLLFFLAVTIWSAPLIDFPGEADATAEANAYLTIDDIGWFTHGGAGISFALTAVAASTALLRARTVPSWLDWLSLVIGAAAAATVAFVGIFAWLAWILVCSVPLLVRRA